MTILELPRKLFNTREKRRAGAIVGGAGVLAAAIALGRNADNNSSTNLATATPTFGATPVTREYTPTIEPQDFIVVDPTPNANLIIPAINGTDTTSTEISIAQTPTVIEPAQ